MLYKRSLVNILENVFVFIEILLKCYFSKGVYSFTLSTVYIYIYIYILYIYIYIIYIYIYDYFFIVSGDSTYFKKILLG